MIKREVDPWADLEEAWAIDRDSALTIKSFRNVDSTRPEFILQSALPGVDGETGVGFHEDKLETWRKKNP
jgi:hypothetical protein